MKRDDFKTSVTNQSPSEELPKPLTALWWQKKGDWDQAHVIVQSDKTKDGAWVHALLHRGRRRLRKRCLLVFKSKQNNA